MICQRKIKETFRKAKFRDPICCVLCIHTSEIYMYLVPMAGGDLFLSRTCSHQRGTKQPRKELLCCEVQEKDTERALLP